MSSKKNVAIIGAGPAGLFAAEILAAAGHAVSVYDHKPSPARKFLMAGRGGLNITHSEEFDVFITRYGAAAEYLRPALMQFMPQDMRDWCAGLGQETFIGSSGRVFPKSLKASPLLRAWITRLESLGVIIHPNYRWVDTDGCSNLMFDTPNGEITISPDIVLLALGGASWPRLGSDAAWVPILKKLGVQITPFEPSNCGFVIEWSPYFKEKFAGTPLKSIAVTHHQKTVRGEIMITANGVEGGAIYALSSDIRHTLHHHMTAKITLDLKPDIAVEKLITLLSAARGRDSFSNFLRKHTGLPPVAISLLQENSAVRDMQPSALAAAIKKYPLTLTAPFGLGRAISSAGGVAWASINTDYMLKSCPGIFVAGEMIDWDAPTGGYLLQASFATAKAAANGIIRYLQG